ncbi:relaxase/mobilization nuclease domain-containing protein [Roseivivax sp.]
MTRRDDDLRIRPGRIRDGGRTSKQPTRFVNEVMRAARKSGHTGYRIGAGSTRSGNAAFGRGRFARTAKGLTRTSRRVVVKARIVRHQGKRFRSAPMAKHLGYLQRDGVGQDGRDADLFGPESNDLDRGGFAARCEDDRHHFRFIISPEDAGDLEDLHAFTRDLMARAERDLGTTLDWVAVDHWNTDNPHIHILVRGKADDGRDLVISRDYISRGLRARAEDLVQLELGPRSAREISQALETQVTAERWTDLDRGLRSLADDHASIADLRRGTPEPRDPALRRLMIGRAQTLERLGLAEQIAPAVWELKPNAEDTLRELGMRGDIIKRMHRAMGADRNRAAGDFAIEGTPTAPILGRLVERGFHDDHAGSGYAIIDGVDGRVHHLRFRDLDATGDTPQGGIVETRLWTGKTDGTPQLSLVGRSDLSLAAQIEADGATWLDRLHLARDRAPLSGAGFGADVRQALERRSDHLVAEGLARRQGQRVTFARDLLATLRNRGLDAIAQDLSTQTGLPHHKPTEGEPVAGTFRQRLDLASGRFAMIDDGLGFSLVPWTPQLERHLGQTVTGTITPGGGIDWSLGRKRGLSL